MLPLKVTKSGEKVSVCCFACSHGEACRLREMGCVEGAFGVVVSNQANVILQVGETRLAINGNLAKSILVNPV